MGELPEDLVSRFKINYVSGIREFSKSKVSRAEIEVVWIGVSESVDKELLNKFPNLKVLASSSTGITHIDERIFQHSEITLITLRNEKEFLGGITATAELAWSLFLSSHRKIILSDRTGHYTTEFRERYFSNQIVGSTIGIIGLGRVGLHIANYANSFGASVKFTDIVSVGHPDFCEEVSLVELCQTSDALFVCASTGFAGYRPILDGEHVRMLKRGATLINVSRGGLVDEREIIASLREGKISGYATDVLQIDETTSTSPIFLDEIRSCISSGGNLIVTPHLGGACFDALASVNRVIMKRILEQFEQICTENSEENPIQNSIQ
jgi:D-3-phosphoglycerate dehydrogenase